MRRPSNLRVHALDAWTGRSGSDRDSCIYSSAVVKVEPINGEEGTGCLDLFNNPFLYSIVALHFPDISFISTSLASRSVSMRDTLTEILKVSALVHLL